jgi:hypothetical protein
MCCRATSTAFATTATPLIASTPFMIKFSKTCESGYSLLKVRSIGLLVDPSTDAQEMPVA